MPLAGPKLPSERPRLRHQQTHCRRHRHAVGGERLAQDFPPTRLDPMDTVACDMRRSRYAIPRPRRRCSIGQRHRRPTWKWKPHQMRIAPRAVLPPSQLRSDMSRNHCDARHLPGLSPGVLLPRIAPPPCRCSRRQRCALAAPLWRCTGVTSWRCSAPWRAGPIAATSLPAIPASKRSSMRPNCRADYPARAFRRIPCTDRSCSPRSAACVGR